LSTYVRFIECFRNCDLSKAECNLNESPGCNKQASEECHPIKRAIAESIFDDYGQYQNIIGKMRAEHISLRVTRKLSEILIFAHVWCKRLRFIRSLFSLIGSNDGIQLINLFYQKTTFLCHLDWEYGLLMNAIVRSSNEFNNICSKWLLDAYFSEQTIWMIRIIDIGRKVHFLKVLRSTRFYEFAREERLEIIQRYLISSIWHDPPHRASLSIVLHKLDDIICDDMRIELIQNHRMVDHLVL
uniref:Gamma-tubulin complex component n=1 Tax=Meloidogyne floridensis TaxID=298350 RepID=A0A915NGT3_9BILA